VDLGGSKIELAVLDAAGREVVRRRARTPHSGYDSALETLAGLVLAVEADAGGRCTVGLGMPGSVSPQSGRVFNAYNTPFNARRLKRDLEQRLAREVRVANDANCFALSEAVDGAGRGAAVAFGAVLGTGVGGAIVVDGKVLYGRNGISGEWGHTPLPWMTPEEYPGPRCNCGRLGCIEQLCAGPALGRLKEQAENEEAAFALYEDRLARAFSLIVNFLDPDVIILGGGVSNVDRLYVNVPKLMSKYVYSDSWDTPVVRAAHGDASGVRGAAMLWP
jgi:fructokinase